MLKKTIVYEEALISEEVKTKCQKYLQDNPISIYYDYRDRLSLEHVEKIMTSMDDYYELENEVYELNLDYICNLENQLIEEMQSEYEELKDFDVNDLREEFMDYIIVNNDIEQLLKNTPDVRIRVVVHSNYEGVGYQSREDDNFKHDDYVKHLKRILKDKYEEKSFQQELDNICSCVNQFIFYMKCDVKSLIAIKEKFKRSITIPKNSWAGFYDSWNGSGSVLEVKLTDDVKLKKQHGKTQYDNIEIVLDENNKYSVENVYGLCDVPECILKVK